jgi:hypothetical protein
MQKVTKEEFKRRIQEGNAAKAAVKGIIPEDAHYQVLDGPGFVRIREASKLRGLHPLVVSMGREMVQRIGGGSGVAFPLSTPELREKANETLHMLKVGLAKYAKAMVQDKHLTPQVYRDTTSERIVCWYVETRKKLKILKT